MFTRFVDWLEDILVEWSNGNKMFEEINHDLFEKDVNHWDYGDQ